jgi:competence protein CoiA
MLVAKSNHQYVIAEKANKKEKYTCPGCLEPVVLKRGIYKIPHFAHQANAKCQQFSESETVEHLQGKLELAKMLDRFGKVSIEGVLHATRQRPDVLVTLRDERRIAIEFQCSPISFEHLKKRTTEYEQHGITVIWILGSPYCQRGVNATTIMKFIHEQCVLFYDIHSKSLQVYFDFIKVDYQKLRYQQQSTNFEKLYQIDNQSPNVTRINVAQASLRLQQQVMKGQIAPEWITQIYTFFRGSPALLPVWVHGGHTFGLKIANWQWRTRLLMSCEYVGQRIILTDLVQQLANQVYFLETLANGYRRLVTQQLIRDAAIAGYLRLEGQYVVVLNRPVLYASFQDKMMAAHDLHVGKKVLK